MRPHGSPDKAGIIRTEADIAAGLSALVRIDPRLEAVAATAGPLPLRRDPGGLPGLARIIVAQQVSRASAAAIFARLEAEFDIADPQAFLSADDAVYRRAGLSRPKQRTVRAVAKAVDRGDLDLARVEVAPVDTALAELVGVSGVGPWTAECYLLFCAGHPDVFPSGDLALRVALAHAFHHDARPSARQAASLALAWAPHRSVAARLFWAYYAAITRREAAPAA
ncbi:DNA-3-methyladenine glycosylase 2 family protein [Aurantimonas sp. A2-1-M11]|uniref:DNA-3-methyladenine glycosylase family protein n=1 Tax=Aurantimonas sp. A2-1-M11 TaxID=3113712 RepID=UPI002F936024